MNRPSPDDMKAMGVVDYGTGLEMENKKLKAENKKLKACKSLYILLKERINGGIEIQNKLRTENKTLKEKLVLTENDRDEWEVKAKDLLKENKELKEKLEEVAKELIQHHEEYKNMADMVVKLESENKTLKKKLDILYHHV